MEIVPRGRRAPPLGTVQAALRGLNLARQAYNWMNPAPQQPQNPPGTGRRFRRRGGRGRGVSTPVQPIPMPIYPAFPRGRGRGRGRGRVLTTNPGRSVTITQSEVWGDVVKGPNVFTFQPSAIGMPQLKHLAAGYTRYKVIRVTLEYEPAVGRQRDGVIHWGIRPGVVAKASATPEVCKAAYPRRSHPVYVRTTMTIGHDLIMMQPWLGTGETAFTLVANSPGDTTQPGFFECTYHVVLDLPKPP